MSQTGKQGMVARLLSLNMVYTLNMVYLQQSEIEDVYRYLASHQSDNYSL